MAGGSNTLLDRFKQEPLVPLGAAATLAAFLYAAHGMHRGNFKQTQWGMRSRVALQGLTVCALLGYSLYRTDEHQTGRKDHVRAIDWERLERESIAAEKTDRARQDDAVAGPLPSDKVKQPTTVFAQEPKSGK
ncbi:Respiratory supercomplex factor 1, mitochondrial [Coemansia sp. RSA 2322]|uniref:Respiratory supercomplex factor 1, mitochondrial n=1 Tax=Coemansia thaxteri TaxID=2663907 RepID=A0A9W8BBZ3_9FUNG|nr:Respiratory supercomplex factor 1, mitochondrial [Coemansia thaxteri]KAJ2461887.1 Respiratory supercomplex factor 1, mitochondrial [Coemansia sp. RSA 2320]KAJ2472427.1 Respiratory supercomplex factor 1, mitochondrial [Coemansia sp. RSA 2322]